MPYILEFIPQEDKKQKETFGYGTSSIHAKRAKQNASYHEGDKQWQKQKIRIITEQDKRP
ncbi:hypothetical protein PvtlMGM1_0056 [Prevotella sp. MGM1]|nr:hypothetical protein PvtlMGM1_0056 [Prevotella sp. MGM1]